MGITNDNTQALYMPKTSLVSLVHTWYDSQGFFNRSRKWATLSSHLHHYFILSNYKRRARKTLATFCMYNRSITEYINAFCKNLVSCADVQE